MTDDALNPVWQARQALREEMSVRRQALSLQAWSERSAHIAARVLTLDAFQSAQCVHLYLASEKKREADTDAIRTAALGSGKRVLVPVVQGEALVSVEVTSSTLFSKAPFGLIEPAPIEPALIERFSKTPAVESDIDLIIVPLLAADRTGNRLGYGKGYYDRFLTRLFSQHIRPITIGLCFDFQLVPHIPALEKTSVQTRNYPDIALDIIITESDFS